MTRGPVARPLLAGLALVLAPGTALAHADRPPAPHDLAGAWSLEPTVLIGLAATATLYGVGLFRLWWTAGIGRGIPLRRAVAFMGGIVALVVALVSPLDALGEALFSAHMAQHLVLIVVAAPLLIAAAPRLAFLWALPIAWRRALGSGRLGRGLARGAGALAHPAAAFALASAALWAWHLPGPYETALASEPVHAAEHASFLATGLLFWWVVIAPEGRRSLSAGAGILYVLAMAAQSSALGALLTFAPEPWYTAHAEWTASWGLTPLEDQQLAGVVMWVPAGFVYLAATGWLFLDWLDASNRRVERFGPVAPGIEGGGR